MGIFTILGEAYPDLRTHVLFAVEHAADGNQHGLAHLLLGDVTAGAGFEGAFGMDGCSMHGKHQHRQTFMAQPDFLHYLQAAAVFE